MFTGIITHVGTVAAIDKTGDWTFTIAAKSFTDGLAMGASIACNGCCLTAIAWNEDSFTVQVSAETLSRTSLGKWQVGSKVNLERALKVGDELGGHFVTGHVDGLAKLEKMENSGESVEWWLSIPSCHSRLRGNDKSLISFIAEKGSVTLDGVSLTVNEVKDGEFSINLIPHTQQSTNFHMLKAGDSLNLEVDILARYIARQKD